MRCAFAAAAAVLAIAAYIRAAARHCREYLGSPVDRTERPSKRQQIHCDAGRLPRNLICADEQIIGGDDVVLFARGA